MFAGKFRYFAGSYFAEGNGVVAPSPPRRRGGIGGSGIPGSRQWLERMLRLGASQHRESYDDDEAVAALRALDLL